MNTSGCPDWSGCGCPDCGMAYSFVFGTQFHMATCPAVTRDRKQRDQARNAEERKEQAMCETNGCKANLAHRKGIHSWWCPKWTAADAKAKEVLERTGKNIKQEV